MDMLVTLLAGQAMASMDGEILVIAAPSLRADLHASAAQLQLIVAAYALAFGALVVLGARLGDVLGYRRAYMLGVAAFTLASLAGGLAPSATILIGAVALQGAAAAVMSPQVLSIIQLHFRGDARERAIGAYSMVLAAGVAAGLVLGGLLITADLLGAAWRPALLLNVPLGAIVLLAARTHLPRVAGEAQAQLDPAAATTLSVALLALIVPLTLGRDASWPIWVWPFFALCATALVVFVRLERHIAARGRHPLLDLHILTVPGVAPGIVAVALVMACYAGFLFSLTLHLQGGLGYSPLAAGLIFATYASGFGTASLTWTRFPRAAADHLPIAGPLVLAATLFMVGRVAVGDAWPVVPAIPLLFLAGAAHACAFSPLTARLTEVVRSEQAADLSGLVLTASLIGQVIGVAGFGGVYFSAGSHGSAHAFAVTTMALGGTLMGVAVCAYLAQEAPHWT
jgi:MFS family permease